MSLRRSRFLITALIATGALLVGALGLFACSRSTTDDGAAVAATVNDVAIPEEDVTAYIQSYRAQLGCSDDERWKEVLSEYQTDASTVRTDIINGVFVVDETVRQEAQKQGVSATDDEVDAAVASARVSFGYADDDAGWAQYLSDTGYTEERFRNEVEASVLKEKLCEAELDNPTDDEIKASLLENLATYATWKSSYIAFSDEATATEVHDTLKQSTDLATDFAAAAAQYSTDGGKYADSAGNVGWDILKADELPEIYKEAVTGLSTGQMSSVIHDSDNDVYYIIYCTGEFATGDTTGLTLDDIPADLSQQLYESEESYLWTDKCDTYIDDLVSQQDVVINDMPSGLPYDVS